MKDILVLAPHGDDETLGCGGTLLRFAAEGARLHWVLMTSPDASTHPALARRRADEIESVQREYGFASRHELRHRPAHLDILPGAVLVEDLARVVEATRPQEIYLPWVGDAHSDHRATFYAGAAVTKRFRHPSVRRVLAYETLSETDHGLDPAHPFVPNVFTDITGHLETKLSILSLYAGELDDHPFPRSKDAASALAVIRGAACGVVHAEAFMLLREVR